MFSFPECKTEDYFFSLYHRLKAKKRIDMEKKSGALAWISVKGYNGGAVGGSCPEIRKRKKFFEIKHFVLHYRVISVGTNRGVIGWSFLCCVRVKKLSGFIGNM